MRSFLLMSTGLLSACGGTNGFAERSNGVFVESSAADFAVFTQGEDALAIFVGAGSASNETWVIHAAQAAIEQVTGCPVVRDSVQADDKTVSVRVDCSQSTGLFRRVSQKSRGPTNRSGFGNGLALLSMSTDTR